jgi:hypothetical protein
MAGEEREIRVKRAHLVPHPTDDSLVVFEFNSHVMTSRYIFYVLPREATEKALGEGDEVALRVRIERTDKALPEAGGAAAAADAGPHAAPAGGFKNSYHVCTIH